MFNIMVIDDSKLMLDIIEEILLKEVNTPLNIVTFLSAIDAKNQLAPFQPDLIITDIEMPEVNGYEFIEDIKQESNIIILAISGSTFKGNLTDTILYAANLIGADYTMMKSDIQNKLPSMVMHLLCENKGM
jgi:CheY-like chemotaxis protein